jgi:hypothetical protein
MSKHEQVGEMLTSTWEVLVQTDKNGWRYLVQVIVVAEADWLAEIEAEKRVRAAMSLGESHYLEAVRRRRLTVEERLEALMERQVFAHTRQRLGGADEKPNNEREHL